MKTPSGLNAIELVVARAVMLPDWVQSPSRHNVNKSGWPTATRFELTATPPMGLCWPLNRVICFPDFVSQTVAGCTCAPLQTQ